LNRVLGGTIIYSLDTLAQGEIVTIYVSIIKII
jgi:hypothetical protein